VLFGVGIYLVWEAPVILSEAAFELVLASALGSAAGRMQQPGWMGSVFRATWLPFALVLAMATAFAGVAQHFCPEATRLSEVLRMCVQAER
jgi:hypothetical protein